MMYRVEAPQKITEKAWGLDFVEGVASTNDTYLAQKLKQRGYEVSVLEDHTPKKAPRKKTDSEE